MYDRFALVELALYADAREPSDIDLDQSRRPTQRALDSGDSAASRGIFLASGLYSSQAESTFRPAASNANRWA
jgi:hypothetical protein